MILPGRGTLVVAAGLAVLLLAAPLQPALVIVALAGDLLLVAICIVEGRSIARRHVRVEREHRSRLEINRSSDMVYRIENLGRRRLFVSVRQPWPPSVECDPARVDVDVAPGELVRVAMSIVPRRRGRVHVPAAQVDVHHAGDIARRRWEHDDGAVVSVYPDLHRVVEYDVLRRHRALRQFGIHRMRMIGAGREFDQLREYLPDDDYRDINWKATARRRRPITSVYQAERSQDVLLCIDCGRMMGNPIGAGTVLDGAIDAAIVLAHVCGGSGDSVGLVLFRDTVTRYIKPGRRGTTMNRIIEQLVNAQHETVFPSYAALVSSLRVNQKRRSMVFLFTDLNDPQLAANLTEVLPLVSRRHVFVVVSMRDPLLEKVADGPPSDRRGLYQVLAARKLADERAGRVRELMRAGVQVLEVDADAITVEVINRYLHIKMRQLV